VLAPTLRNHFHTPADTPFSLADWEKLGMQGVAGIVWLIEGVKAKEY